MTEYLPGAIDAPNGMYYGCPYEFYIAYIYVDAPMLDLSKPAAWTDVIADAVKALLEVNDIARDKDVVRIDVDCDTNVAMVLFANRNTCFFSNS